MDIQTSYSEGEKSLCWADTAVFVARCPWSSAVVGDDQTRLGRRRVGRPPPPAPTPAVIPALAQAGRVPADRPRMDKVGGGGGGGRGEPALRGLCSPLFSAQISMAASILPWDLFLPG